MLTLRQIDKKDYPIVKSILKANGIENDLSQGIIYSLNNQDGIIGVGKIYIKDSYGILEYVFVKEKFRGSNYGDSILRGLLFKCQSMGINKVYCYEYNSYLLKIGFTHNNEPILKDYKLYLEIDDFFNNSCCGDINGV